MTHHTIKRTEHAECPRGRVPRAGYAFTLVELLTVVAILSLLISLMAPSLEGARALARQAKCTGNLTAINRGVEQYLAANRGYYHVRPSNRYIPNHGLWTDASGVKLSINDSYAYWGLAYEDYAPGPDLWNCPSSVRVDDWWRPQDQHRYRNSCYGINDIYYNGKYVLSRGNRDIFPTPSTTILVQDHVEQKMDNNAGGDTFAIPPGQSINLFQWRFSLGNAYPNSVKECFRHTRKSCTLWMDGHVSTIQESTGENVPLEWYTGEIVIGGKGQ